MWFPYSHGVIQIGCTVSERMDIIMSGNKDLRELTLEDMEKVSGGMHDREENRRYEIFEGGNCPHCGRYFATDRELNNHIRTEHP